MLDRKYYKEALEVQDACNLSGVVHSFSRTVSALWEVCKSTDEVNRHPISRLYAEQIMFLSGGGGGDVTTYQEAYYACKREAEREV